MADYIPEPDADFLAWMTTFHAYAALHAVEVGLDPADVTEILARKTAFATKVAAHNTARDDATAAFEAKEAERATAEAYFRTMARRMTYNELTPEQRAALGLPVRDTTRTRVAVPTSKPVLQIALGTMQQHRLSFADEGTPTDKKKPDGVRAAEIWFKKGGAAPATEADWTFLALDTATPYVLVFNVEEVGTSVWYRARWVNRREEHGPWSAVATAKVPG